MNSFRLLCVGCVYVYRTRVYVDGKNLQKLVVFFIFFARTTENSSQFGSIVLLLVLIHLSSFFPTQICFCFSFLFRLIFRCHFLSLFFTKHTYLISQRMSVCVSSLFC